MQEREFSFLVIREREMRTVEREENDRSVGI
jgi:hypothetical protein